MSKNLIGNVCGVLIALAAVLAAVKYSGSGPSAVAEPESVPVVIEVDPNQAAINVQAPAAIKVGELAVLDVSASNADSYVWKVKPDTKNFLVIDGGRRAVFSAEAAGEYLFFVSGAKGGTVDSQIHTIQVGKGVVAPKADIGAKVPGWVDKVQSKGKRDEAIRLAQSFSSVAAMVTPTTPAADIIAMTAKSNRDALGGSITAWEPFLVELQNELEARVSDGSLSDANSHVEAWRSISKALTDVANASVTRPTSTSVRSRR